MCDISVVIVNYNTRQLTLDCIDSVKKMSIEVDYEIIVVDNASNDDSLKFLRNIEDVILIESARNLGFGRANNLGYQNSKGKHVLLLNSDTIFKNNVLKIFLKKISSLDTEVVCVGSPLLQKDLAYTVSYGWFPNAFDMITSFVKRQKMKSSTPTRDTVYPYEVDYIIGADLLIKRSVIEKYGLFSSDFFMYFEETELQKRYKSHGFKSVIIDGPQIVHLENNLGTVDKPIHTTINRYLYFEGMFVYFKKDLNPIMYLIWRMLVMIYWLPVTVKSKGKFFDKIKLSLLFFGIKTISHD